MLLELKNLNKAFKEAASKHEPKDDKPFTTMQAVKVRHVAFLVCFQNRKTESGSHYFEGRRAA
jgi:hypothetical protein